MLLGITPIVSGGTQGQNPAGQLWAWGSGTDYQRGDGVTTPHLSSPVQTGLDSDWAEIAVTTNHTLAIKTDGTLWAWGSNNFGELGFGDTTTRSLPTQVGTDTNWLEVYCAYNASFALRDNGAGGTTLWSWGLNHDTYGTLGHGDIVDRSSPVQVGSATNWSSLPRGSCGAGYSMGALQSDGTLWTWGENQHGQLGQNNTTIYQVPTKVGLLTNWSMLSVCPIGMAAIKTTGDLWAWGNNQLSQLGDGTATVRSSPVQIDAGTTWTHICKGYVSAWAVKSPGTLWSWGLNEYGELAQNDITNRSTPTQVASTNNWSIVTSGQGYNTSVHGTRQDNTLFGWGRWNCIGDGSTLDRSSPVQIGFLEDWSLDDRQFASDSGVLLTIKV